MKAIGLVANWQKKERVIQMVKQINDFFAGNKIKIYINQSDEASLDIEVDSILLEDFPAKVDLVIVLGGDGTILRVARELMGKKLPLLGLNLGHMGFLAEVEPTTLIESLQKLLDGRYKIIDRMMLSAKVLRKEVTAAEYTALNEIVITKGPFSRIIYVDTYVNNKFLESYPGDGVIVASPTGSTGYSLSAGGPIVNPALDVMILTPICPHLLHHRSVIVPGDESVMLQVKTRQTEVVLTVDGQVGFSIKDDDMIIVTRSAMNTPLIQLEGSDFYVLLHHKLMKAIRKKPERQ